MDLEKHGCPNFTLRFPSDCVMVPKNKELHCHCAFQCKTDLAYSAVVIHWTVISQSKEDFES